jgi:hypothetical protein
MCVPKENLGTRIKDFLLAAQAFQPVYRRWRAGTPALPPDPCFLILIALVIIVKGPDFI